MLKAFSHQTREETTISFANPEICMPGRSSTEPPRQMGIDLREDSVLAENQEYPSMEVKFPRQLFLASRRSNGEPMQLSAAEGHLSEYAAMQ